VPLGDLDAFVAEIDFDAELAAKGVDVAAQGVDLGVFDLTAFQGTDAVLANVQQASQLGLGESLGLARPSSLGAAFLFPQPTSVSAVPQPTSVSAAAASARDGYFFRPRLVGVTKKASANGQKPGPPAIARCSVNRLKAMSQWNLIAGLESQVRDAARGYDYERATE
jgi:hypothetical protein